MEMYLFFNLYYKDKNTINLLPSVEWNLCCGQWETQFTSDVYFLDPTRLVSEARTATAVATIHFHTSSKLENKQTLYVILSPLHSQLLKIFLI